MTKRRHSWTMELVDSGYISEGISLNPPIPYWVTVDGPCRRCGLTKAQARKSKAGCQPV